MLGFGLAEAGIKLLLVARAGESAAHGLGVGRPDRARCSQSSPALVAAGAFGIVPALRASRPDLADILRATGRTGGLARGRALRNAVVMAEVALSFVLLIGCGLMLRSFIALQRVDPGFDPKGVLTFFGSALARAAAPDVQAGDRSPAGASGCARSRASPV